MSGKNGKKALEPKHLVLAVVLTVLVLAVVIFYPRNGENNQVTETPGTLTEEKVDKEDDGVYVNYKYGYKFEYPNDKFKQNFSDAEGGGWVYTIEGNQYYDLNVHPLNNNFYDAYNDLYELKPGEDMQIKHVLMTKLRSHDFGEVKLIVVTIKTLPGAETEPVSGYEAVWMKRNKDSISLSLYDYAVIDKGSTKELFDQIVNSFEFINQ